MPPQEKIESFLDSLENFELAFFYKYKSNSYLEESNNIVKNYIEAKGLTNKKREALIDEYKGKQFVDNKKRCPRCRSDKIRITNKENTLQYHMHCKVCGLNLNHPRKGAWRLIFEFLRDFVLNIGH